MTGMAKVSVLVQMFQGLVNDVRVFSKAGDAEKAFKEYTKVEYDDYVKADCNLEDLEDFDEHHEGTTIYDVEIE